jgi:N-acetylmuramoyl-L-alanine amidase
MKRWLLVVLVAGAAGVRAEGPAWPEETDEVVLPVPSTTVAVAEPLPERPALKIVHPPEGAALPAVRSSFVYGFADPRGQLTVNGRAVPIHPGGGWLTMVPYGPGANTLQAELRLPTETAVATRRVTVAGGGGGAVTGVTPLRPAVDVTLRGGEMVSVQALAPAGREVYFQVGDGTKKHALTERGAGYYRGLYTLSHEKPLKDAKIKITSFDKKKNRRETATAPGKISLLDETTPWVVEVSTDMAILRTGPGPQKNEKAGYAMFPPPTTRLWVTGQRGDELRVRLSASREAWIGEDEVRRLPAGTPPPLTTVGAVSIDAVGRHTRVRMALGQRVPYEVRVAEEDLIEILFFGASSNTDWMHYNNAPQSAVKRAEWFQDDSTTYRLRLHTHPGRWWGYDARYENGTFVLELRRPLANPKAPASLAGLRVIVDPGHSSDRGAIGPTEYLEKDANLAIAKCLEKKLLQEKAEVTMLRNGSEHVALYDRPKAAWAAGGDILISVHNNALPEGSNPFERNGFGVYYYQPHGFGLANAIYNAYREQFGREGASPRLRDDGFHYGNLALPRTPQMPSVLTESAYMILPEEEALLKTEKFQCDCADVTVRGIKRFLEEIRRKDTPTP